MHKFFNRNTDVIQMESVSSSVATSRSRVDIISKLPESLITHILSYLPTKDAVHTSVLSTRWIECWTFITKLNFNDNVFFSPKRKKSSRKQHFINFVNRALHLTKSNSVGSFSLVIANKYDATLLNTWISCILKRKLNAPLLESVLIEQQDLESVSREPRSCKIKFSVTYLKEFIYCGDGISQAFILQVRCIKFHGSEVLTQPNMAVLPKFAMLTHLDLGSVSSKVLLGLLQKSPVLNTLVFKGILKFNQELLNSAVVPDCLTFTLKVVKFGIVHGYKHELFLAKYFMENGVVLERMSFYLANPWQSDSNDMFLMLPASNCLQIGELYFWPKDGWICMLVATSKLVYFYLSVKRCN
ncbi:F-box/FBD/LRR-repeat protein [Trifolium repens]|nr:F-box/FBD/LRR-repeat protein [Trifolium repens]